MNKLECSENLVSLIEDVRYIQVKETKTKDHKS